MSNEKTFTELMPESLNVLRQIGSGHPNMVTDIEIKVARLAAEEIKKLTAERDALLEDKIQLTVDFQKLMRPTVSLTIKIRNLLPLLGLITEDPESAKILDREWVRQLQEKVEKVEAAI